MLVSVWFQDLPCDGKVISQNNRTVHQPVGHIIHLDWRIPTFMSAVSCLRGPVGTSPNQGQTCSLSHNAKLHLSSSPLSRIAIPGLKALITPFRIVSHSAHAVARAHVECS
ncbi:hypothetical protein PAXRUDRAFT_671819 [Paxillus rubicundulus Ve08.2h10]|uniref:Unplaced genomic scaffold scaffold_67, whole genome shotgun sequence n=1 Tax=Paxillus rubicundulus Ve08.2h10 TaxID=930991 RepID=A0A0D0DJH5_9AGAM|nr:hypothetical protein PAXRUDRAFT_671819 [Paxillus rubicundulus Ve08.2h10]